MKACKLVCAITAATALAAVAAAQRPGDLVVTPTRVNLDTKNKSGDITLLNKGNQAVRYRLNLVDMEMSENGVLKRTSSPVQNSGAGIFRMSPREIVLQPGESQRIKILAILPAGLKHGEYRSHLSFEPIAAPRPADKGTGEGSALSLRLELRSVVTIPVIARHGEVSATASISDVRVDKDSEGWLTSLKLTRSGNRSVRGDLQVQFVPAGGGAKIPLGQIANLPVYFPNTHRYVVVRLDKDIASLGKGSIEVTFTEPARGRGAVAAKAVASIAE